MDNPIYELLKIQISLPTEYYQARSNCFNATQYYWSETKKLYFTGPEEFVDYLTSFFIQVPVNLISLVGDNSVIWSHSFDVLQIGEFKPE